MSMAILEGVQNTILVMSGKGGVGKSSVSVQIAATLKNMGYTVGILDIDLCGPSIPRMVGVENQDVLSTPEGKWIPIPVGDDGKFSIMSLAFFLDSKSDAVIWRGPKKNAMIKQLLTCVRWNVDFLIIDTPPGTSDEHISVMDNLRNIPVKGCVLVTTPQLLAIDDVRREITFCQRTGLKILGILENMSGFICPCCSECSNILAHGGGEVLAKESAVKFLGRIPIDTNLSKCLEIGQEFTSSFSDSQTAKTFQLVVSSIIKDV